MSPPRVLPACRACAGPGFSLLEILASIAIVATLAAMLVPGIAKLKDAGLRSKCAGNLKQIGSALLAYAGEHQGELPSGGVWDREIGPYLGMESPSVATQCKVLQCPRDPFKRSSGHPRSYMASAFNPADPSNQVGVFSRWSNGAAVGASTRLQALPRPSVTIMVAELFNADNRQFEKAFAYLQAPGWVPGSSSIPKLPDGSFYHGKGQNYLFCDGHVETMSPEGIKTDIPNWDGGRWRALSK
jgi:prepilin-type processing-associated H-X9-DG protein/prepilin-type N-terminal cleavage/methylation domain-containing protein